MSIGGDCSKGKIQETFDVVMVNNENIFIIEVKYEAQDKDLKKVIVQKYENFKFFSLHLKTIIFIWV